MWRYDGHISDGYFGPFMILGGVLTLLFWIGVIAFGVWAVKKFTDRPRSGQNEAMKILQERFARGEIDAEEYDRRRRILEG